MAEDVDFEQVERSPARCVRGCELGTRLRAGYEVVRWVYEVARRVVERMQSRRMQSRRMQSRRMQSRRMQSRRASRRPGLANARQSASGLVIRRIEKWPNGLIAAHGRSIFTVKADLSPGRETTTNRASLSPRHSTSMKRAVGQA